MRTALDRLYQSKLQLLAVLSALLGVILLMLARSIESTAEPVWLANLPLTDLGSALFTTGLLAVAFEYIDRKDGDERANQRLRQVLREEAPAIRDAVINGFAFAPDDLARVATPETLDQIVQNGLGIRLGDQRFAEELYVDIRDQAIRAVERWSDARINIRLSIDRSIAESNAPTSRTSQPQPGADGRVVVTIRHEYTTIPSSQTRRFASVSDHDEYRELTQDGAATFAWFTNPSSGVDAGSTEAFELVQFSVDGTERPIRRAARRGGQLYTVGLGIPEVERQQPVRLAFTYRLMPPAHSRWLYVDVEQPTRGLDVELDYSDTTITQVNMLDFIASSQKSIITKTPPRVPGKTVGLEFDGWLMPKSGVVFVWTTEADLAHSRGEPDTDVSKPRR
ncbi:MAG: hypothetical protein ACT4RN_01765 [Pseudonocardia sp.]